jgi:dTDP-4-amino-4,6-dideoxygalactose transaminase
MERGGGRRIELHAPPAARTVALTGDDEEVRAGTTAAVAALLDDPPLVVLTGSCSAALEASATLLDLRPGDEVVVPAFTFPTSVSAFAARGATIRFAEVDPRTGNLDPASALERIGDRTRAVAVTHYAGIGADLEALGPRLAEVGAEVVEDAAHGLFARAGDRALGRLGRFGCLSFHRTKNLSSLDGGALVVNDPADVDRALVAVDKGTNRVAFDEGLVRFYEWAGLGSAWRMPEAALRYLAEELAQAEAVQARRLAVWDRYRAELAGWADGAGVGLPVVPEGRRSPAHLFFLVLPEPADRERFVAHCGALGVVAARHFGSLPDSAYGRTIRHPDDACPASTRFAERLVRIPLHHQLSDDDVDRVVDAVTAWRPD